MQATLAPITHPAAPAVTSLRFNSWRSICPGRIRWTDPDGRTVSILDDRKPGEATNEPVDAPFGVRLRALAPERVPPFLSIDKPWEAGGMQAVTLLHDGGRYRLWTGCGWGDLHKRGRNCVSYLESDDGFHFRRVPYSTTEPGTNIIDQPIECVFIDPSAPAAERYKFIAVGTMADEQFDRYKTKRPRDIDPKFDRPDAKLKFCLTGGYSPDGLAWTRYEDPLVVCHSDTHNIAHYDARIGKYVVYGREWQMAAHMEDPTDLAWIWSARRSISRMESDDFTRLPAPRITLAPPPSLPPSHVLYTNCFTRLPDDDSSYLMFPTVWDQALDRTHLAMATSADGRVWDLNTDEPVLRPGAPGEWDGGCVYAAPNMVKLPNGDFVLPYTGYNVPHKYPRASAERRIGYLRWPTGRVLGIDAAEDGGFTTVRVVPDGLELSLDAQVRRGGQIAVEITDGNGRVVPGRSFDDAVPVTGDGVRLPVRWRDSGALAERPQAVLLRVRMERATIFGMAFHPGEQLL